MQCPVCHNETGDQSAFCGHCGAPVAAAAAQQAVPPQAAYVPPPASGYPPAAVAGYPQASAAASGLSPNAAAALAYVFVIPAILFLLIEPYNKNPLVRFHSFQSIALAVVWMVLWVVMFFMGMVLLFVPIIHLFFWLIELVVSVGFFILWLVTILKASKGEWFKLPVIGDFAMKQAQS